MVLIVIVALFLFKLAHFYPGRDCRTLWSRALHSLKLVCCRICLLKRVFSYKLITQFPGLGFSEVLTGFSGFH